MDGKVTSVVGLGALTVLGDGVAAQMSSIRSGENRFRPLGGLLGSDSPHAARPAAWIENRKLLTNRKWSPATMAALHVARQAVEDACWTAADLEHAAIVLGTSRGNAAGWLGDWPGRRPFKLMAASNTIHCEPASAISIELGITGPSHVLASGCAAGLDAVGMAMMLTECGVVERALAVAVDLPLVPLLLDNYAASGLLADSFEADPYGANARGFIPAEGAAAMALERGRGEVRLSAYRSNSDAADAVGLPADGGRTPGLFASLALPDAVCPHATGTATQSIGEQRMMKRVFGGSMVSCQLLKPFVGHSIGASGLVESMILAAFLREGNLPPNRSGLTVPTGLRLEDRERRFRGSLAKLAHAMGGHNSLLVMQTG